MKRVVITGLGAVTAVGEGALPLWEAVRNGRSGINFVHFNGGSGDWKTIGARISDFDPEKYITQRKSIKVMARDIQLAVAGASLAIRDSGVQNTSFDRERFGVIVGSGVLNHELDELAYSVQQSIGEDGKLDLKKFGDAGLSNLFPLWLLKYLPNMPACHISILFDLHGLNNTITTGASGGLQAVGEAFRIIQRGDADRMVAGAAESKINPVGLSEYKMLGAFSGSLDGDPKKNYKPFHSGSKGFIVGEGSGFVILEELECAKNRGAKIYAEIAGFGSSSRDGHAIAMKAALRDAHIPASDVKYLQASGIGISLEDEREMGAIHEVFGEAAKNMHVSASKPVTGFTGFSAGVLDVAISTMALQAQEVPPILNFEKSHAAGFIVPTNTAASQKMDYAMTNAFGLNGQSASVITRLYKEGR